MSNRYERRRGKYSAVPEFELSEHSTAEEDVLYEEALDDKFWRNVQYGAIKGTFTAPKIANSIFDSLNIRGKDELLDWNPTSILVNVPSGSRSPFTTKSGVHRKGFFNTLFGNKMKNSLRNSVQRVKLKDYVIKDDFVNWYAESMTNHTNPEISTAFKNVIDTWPKRMKDGKFTMTEVAKWYGSEEYAKLVENGTLSGGEGIYSWMEDIASVGGIKEYVNIRASEWGMNAEDLHYMLYRDGGYEVIPTLNFSGGKYGESLHQYAMHPDDVNLEGILEGMDYSGPFADNTELMKTMDPNLFNDYNKRATDLFRSDAIKYIDVGQDGALSIPEDYLNSKEFFNLPDVHKKDIKIIAEAGDKGQNITMNDWLKQELTQEDVTNADQWLIDQGLFAAQEPVSKPVTTEPIEPDEIKLVPSEEIYPLNPLNRLEKVKDPLSSISPVVDPPISSFNYADEYSVLKNKYIDKHGLDIIDKFQEELATLQRLHGFQLPNEVLKKEASEEFQEYWAEWRILKDKQSKYKKYIRYGGTPTVSSNTQTPSGVVQGPPVGGPLTTPLEPVITTNQPIVPKVRMINFSGDKYDMAQQSDEWISNYITNYEDLLNDDVNPVSGMAKKSFKKWVKLLKEEQNIRKTFTSPSITDPITTDPVIDIQPSQYPIKSDSLLQWEAEGDVSNIDTSDLDSIIESGLTDPSNAITPAGDSSSMLASLEPAADLVEPVAEVAEETYGQAVKELWNAKGVMGKAGTVLSVVSAGSTLASKDSDDTEKALAAATLTAEAAAIGALGTTAASLSWIPYVGPALAVASIIYSTTKKGEAPSFVEEEPEFKRREGKYA